jgi:hypothetical protein
MMVMMMMFMMMVLKAGSSFCVQTFQVPEGHPILMMMLIMMMGETVFFFFFYAYGRPAKVTPKCMSPNSARRPAGGGEANVR